MKKSKIIFTRGSTPKPPKGGLNTNALRLFKPPLGGLGVAAVFIILILNSCKEVGPVVPWGKNGNAVFTTYIESPVQHPQPKNALIEELTGVSCVNCPAAHVILDTLIHMYSPKVIGVSYHLGTAVLAQLENPPPGTLQNMTSVDAQNIASYLQFPGAIPVGAVNRVSHAVTQPYGTAGLWDIPQNWGGYVTTELAATTPVNIYLSAAFIDTSSSKQISISVGLHYTATQTDTNKLSVFLTEDSIITAQLLANNADDTFYVHNHIMRAAVTNALGDPIVVPSFVAGRVDSLTYTYTIPAGAVWNPAHMNVIAFVSQNVSEPSPNPAIVNILQAQIVQLFPH